MLHVEVKPHLVLEVAVEKALQNHWILLKFIDADPTYP
jgi:hypothetical protein